MFRLPIFEFALFILLWECAPLCAQTTDPRTGSVNPPISLQKPPKIDFIVPDNLEDKSETIWREIPSGGDQAEIPDVVFPEPIFPEGPFGPLPPIPTSPEGVGANGFNGADSASRLKRYDND
ncbi:hypothetical protein [Aureimonas altamirensis]|uniref:hypothetical protein n=1 Tax=Aureimonas altamirensis TaxID=370622 RepID=UPI0012DFF706|nr:hypothetical protein [Aureimonas altamirensis]